MYAIETSIHVDQIETLTPRVRRAPEGPFRDRISAEIELGTGVSTLEFTYGYADPAAAREHVARLRAALDEVDREITRHIMAIEAEDRIAGEAVPA